MIIQPPSTLLAGDSGSGKTSAIATQLKAGLHVFTIVTEPDGVSSLLDSCERIGVPVDNLHWAQCFPAAAGWMDLEEMINKVSTMDQKQLADQRDMGKASFRAPALRFLNAFKNFHCDRTNQDYGDFTQWGDDCILNVDSFSGWCTIGFGCTVGFKPTANPGEWGIAQNFVYNMLMKINSDRKCFFNMTAHIEKEVDEMSGVKKVMVSAIGAKLAPKIPKFFGDVIKCERLTITDAKGRQSADFIWSTLDPGMTLKNRALPVSARLPADFQQIVDAYQRRLRSATQSGNGANQPPAPTPVSTPTAVVPPAAPMTPQTGGKQEWK
jgi:hypothetical protein